MTPKRVAVVGLEHYHVTGWVDSLMQLPERAQIVALYDPDPKRGELLAPTYYDPHLSAALPSTFREVPFFTDLDRLLKEQPVDLALVTLQSAAVLPAARLLAPAGVHLLIDKPATRTSTEAAELFGLTRAAGVKTAVGLTRRYGRGWQEARAMVREGRLGRLLTLESVFTTSSVAVRNPANLIFHGGLNRGGILQWLGVHDVDQLLWQTGEPIVEVQAMSARVTREEIDVEDAISVAFRLAGGALGTMHYAYALPRTASDGYMAIRGERGSLKILPDGTLRWFGGGTASDPVTEQETVYVNRAVPGYGATGAAIIADLLDAIEQDREPLAPGEVVIDALRVIDAIYASADTGQRVTIDPGSRTA